MTLDIKRKPGRPKKIPDFTPMIKQAIEEWKEIETENMRTRTNQMDALVRANEYRNEMLAEDRAERKNPELEAKRVILWLVIAVLSMLVFMLFAAGWYLLARAW
jgi:hypothetical protein